MASRISGIIIRATFSASVTTVRPVCLVALFELIYGMRYVMAEIPVKAFQKPHMFLPIRIVWLNAISRQVTFHVA